MTSISTNVHRTMPVGFRAPSPAVRPQAVEAATMAPVLKTLVTRSHTTEFFRELLRQSLRWQGLFEF